MNRPARARVTAVVVTTGTADPSYLNQTLTALAASEAPPQRTLVVRTADDGGAAVAAIAETSLVAELVDEFEAESFGVAVSRALVTAKVDSTWLWLLHDDSAPGPGALGALTQVVETGRSIAIAGCKQVGWDHAERLVSVGVQYTADMQRFTGIEDGEVDQGQHDNRDDVDTVGTAGMLIDREVFVALGGPDPALGAFGDGRDLSRRARLAGHRVVVAPRAVVRHARLSYFGQRPASKSEPESRHSFRPRRTAILHSRFVEAPVAAIPLLAVAAVLAGPARAIGRLASKELRLVGDELWAPVAALAGWGTVWRARRRAAATRTVSRRRLRGLAATWSDVWGVRRDRRLQAAAQRRTVRAPSELEMRERAILGTRRRLTLAAVMVVAVVVAVLTMGPLAFGGPLTGGGLLPVDVSLGDVWRAASSSWLASGDGWAVPADPFLWVVGALSLLSGGAFGTPLWVTVAIVLVAAIPLAALSAWFAAGAATRSMSLRAWAGLSWALAPPLVLALSGGRLGALVAHILLPLVALGIARAFGLDRRDVVISGLVGARRVEPRAATAPSVEVRRRRLEALAAVSQADATAQIARVLAGETPPSGDGPEGGPESDEAGSEAGAQTESVATVGGAEGEESATSRRGAGAAESGGEGGDDDEPVAIGSNTAEPLDDEDDENATIVARPSGVGSVGAAAAAGLALAAATAGAPVLLPAALVSLLFVALWLSRRQARVAGRARLLLVALPALVLFGPLLTYAAQTEQGWRLLLSGPGAATPTPEGNPLLVLAGWPQNPATAGITGLWQWLLLGASGIVVLVAIGALGRAGGLARGVRLAWLIAAVGTAAAVFAPRVEVAVARSVDGASVVSRGWAGPGASLVVLGLLMATLTASGGIRTALHGRSFGWRQWGVAIVSTVLVAGVATSAVGWTAALRGDLLAVQTRDADPVPAIGDEIQTSERQARVLALWVSPSGVIGGAVWRSNGPQLTGVASSQGLGQWERGTEVDPGSADLRSVIAALATGTASDAAAALAAHGIGVVLAPPVGSVAVDTQIDEADRSRLVALLDGVRGLERVTENDSGVVWRVSTEEATAARAVLVDAGGVATLVPSEQVGIETSLAAREAETTLVLAERADPGWRAWLDGEPLRSVSYGWQQAFDVPAGSQGELVVRYETPLHTPWHVTLALTFVVVALIALPTRRRRLEPVEDQ